MRDRTTVDPGIVDAEPWPVPEERQSRALSGRVLVLCLLGIAVLVALAALKGATS